MAVVSGHARTCTPALRESTRTTCKESLRQLPPQRQIRGSWLRGDEVSLGNCLGVPATSIRTASGLLISRSETTHRPRPGSQREDPKPTPQGLHSLAVSHPLSMREALGSIPSVSMCFWGPKIRFRTKHSGKEGRWTGCPTPLGWERNVLARRDSCSTHGRCSQCGHVGIAAGVLWGGNAPRMAGGIPVPPFPAGRVRATPRPPPQVRPGGRRALSRPPGFWGAKDAAGRRLGLRRSGRGFWRAKMMHKSNVSLHPRRWHQRM